MLKAVTLCHIKWMSSAKTGSNVTRTKMVPRTNANRTRFVFPPDGIFMQCECAAGEKHRNVAINAAGLWGCIVQEHGMANLHVKKTKSTRFQNELHSSHSCQDALLCLMFIDKQHKKTGKKIPNSFTDQVIEKTLHSGSYPLVLLVVIKNR